MSAVTPKAEVNSERQRLRYGPLRDDPAAGLIQAPNRSLESCATNSTILNGPPSKRCCRLVGGSQPSRRSKRLKQLENENAKLKKLPVEQMLDSAALRELLAKNSGPLTKREGVAHLRAWRNDGACSIVNADRKMIPLSVEPPPDTELCRRLRDLASERKRAALPPHLPVDLDRKRVMSFSYEEIIGSKIILRNEC